MDAFPTPTPKIFHSCGPRGTEDQLYSEQSDDRSKRDHPLCGLLTKCLQLLRLLQAKGRSLKLSLVAATQHLEPSPPT